jgi:AraC family transcriptional regulator
MFLPNTQVQQKPLPEASNDGSRKDRNKDNLLVMMLTDAPGIVEVPALRNTVVSIHVGPSAHIRCRRGGRSHSGTAIHGDIDLIPCGTPSLWELREKDRALILSITPKFMDQVVEECGLDPRRLEIRNRFQMRDVQIEHIAGALKAEKEHGYPCGRLYLDSLATALAIRLVHCYSSLSPAANGMNGGFSSRKLKHVLSFIEDNLSQDLSLAEIAGIAELSASHCKALFRQSVGVPVHQYVIRRRVERAALLLRESKLPISQVALETGFSHQSHLAMHMRRVLGLSPKMLRTLN